jgi:hypothetical protein
MAVLMYYGSHGRHEGERTCTCLTPILIAFMLRHLPVQSRVVVSSTLPRKALEANQRL